MIQDDLLLIDTKPVILMSNPQHRDFSGHTYQTALPAAHGFCCCCISGRLQVQKTRLITGKMSILWKPIHEDS